MISGVTSMVRPWGVSLNKPKMAYSRDAFITEMRDRLENEKLAISWELVGPN